MSSYVIVPKRKVCVAGFLLWRCFHSQMITHIVWVWFINGEWKFVVKGVAELRQQFSLIFQGSRHPDKVLCSLFLSLVRLTVMFMLVQKPPRLRLVLRIRMSRISLRLVSLWCRYNTVQRVVSEQHKRVQGSYLYGLQYVSHFPPAHVNFWV